MKIKESRSNISLKDLQTVFLATVAISAVLRTIQMFKFIDHGTGFYTGGTVLTAGLYIILVLACLFFAAASFLSEETKKISLEFKGDTTLTVITLIFSLTFFYDSASSFLSSFETVGTVSSGTAFQAMMLSGTIPLFFRSITALFAGIYYILLAKSFREGDGKASKHKFIAVAPVGWAGFRIVHRFVEQISYIKVSELLLELVLLALMILFFMAFAQVNSGVYSKEYRWRIMGCGLSAALLALTLNCSRLICLIVKGSGGISAKYLFNVSDFVFAVFVILLVKNIVSEIKNKEIEGE